MVFLIFLKYKYAYFFINESNRVVGFFYTYEDRLHSASFLFSRKVLFELTSMSFNVTQSDSESWALTTLIDTLMNRNLIVLDQLPLDDASSPVAHMQ